MFVVTRARVVGIARETYIGIGVSRLHRDQRQHSRRSPRYEAMAHLSEAQAQVKHARRLRRYPPFSIHDNYTLRARLPQDSQTSFDTRVTEHQSIT